MTDLILRRHPFDQSPGAFPVRSGQTLGAMLREGAQGAELSEMIEVRIGGIEVPRHLWDRVRPKEGTAIHVTGKVAGRSGWRAVLMIVVTVLAVMTQQYWAVGAFTPAWVGVAAGALVEELAELPPRGDRRMSANPVANGGLLRQALKLPDFREYAVDVESPGASTSEATAVLGLLSADALMKLGEIGRARYWYGTARLAADDTAQPRLQAQVRAQEAMLPYYYGQVEHTVVLARAAQALVPRIVCSAVALACAAEGRALARLGDREGAERAIRRAQRMVDELDEPTNDAAFRFTEKRLLLYLSGTSPTWARPRPPTSSKCRRSSATAGSRRSRSTPRWFAWTRRSVRRAGVTSRELASWR